jgi:hypothetical protein
MGLNPGAQVGPAIVNASAGRKVQKLFHCNYLIYKDLKPSLMKVFEKFSPVLYHLRSMNMKQKLRITLVTEVVS